ncbi:MULTISPECIES: hypothetical protein [Paraburkholderia]|uniref:Uncharacterized protein n=1 Tax=Paraburkholderia madseniana TaxID=2599607 RepID=A0AAP5ETN0_9BURK|nr:MULTISPECIES: hypothetical protein [Paraburkholderia]MCX4151461.1 hypothetical protein [Paraburkholderia madseniana]MDN7154392.1 hypothetical protein [Paraburkholderia sp. WS6]MDQ6413274.1 hypothetical protein [Paraburkholderia madseniana]
MDQPLANDDESRIRNRRAFLRFCILLPAGAALDLKPVKALAGLMADTVTWPEYILRRESNELFLKLKAIGFRDSVAAGTRWLVPVSSVHERYLVFEFPPQHYAEISLPADKEIPQVFDEKSLSQIRLTASAPSQVVFRVRRTRPIRLRLESLLAWDQFELVLPDLDRVAAPYQLDIGDAQKTPSTRIELPWGIDLSPADNSAASAYTFEEPLRVRVTGIWKELWTTSLRRKSERYSPSIPMEVLSVRGFDQKSVDGTVNTGGPVVTYADRPGMLFPPSPTPLSNYARIEIATSLSRRFLYTGKVDPLTSTGVIRYESDDPKQSGCIQACYSAGRTIPVQQLRLSARGGWLQLEGKWDPFPGCALSGWVHSTSLGRDHHVEMVNEGFLYPFGTPCELILLSERVFGLDEQGYFVAPLITQAFLQISQPNSIEPGHAETPFQRISVTTPRSPPLDRPPGGDPETYLHYDFFLPLVGGKPFAFEHVGTDWEGKTHRASMPMIFVNNKARAPNGLIWEPGSQWSPSNPNMVCPSSPIAQGDASHAIDQSAAGEGLRVVDKQWALIPGRFAHYGGSSIALASSTEKGATAQHIDWIEWVRANIPDLKPTSVSAPFRPRARTLRVRIQSMGQISGEPSSSLVTYRDVRFTYSPILDPEPTTPLADYFFNVTAHSPAPEAPYIYMLETRALVPEPGRVTPRSAEETARAVRQAYFGVSVDPSPIPDDLFLGLDNEVRFGRSSSSDGIGGLSVPDTHLSFADRKHGPMGDATFNEGRWKGYVDPARSRIQATQRLDYAAFALRSRPQHDKAPFDSSREPAMRSALVNDARKLMGVAAGPAMMLASGATPGDTPGVAPGLKLGDLFGVNAQIIPGLSFADIFRDIALSSSAGSAAQERAASPPTWLLRTTGIEWLADVLEGRAPLPIPALIAMLQKQAKPALPGGEPLTLGVDAALQWSNDVFTEVPVGPVTFVPTNGETRIDINAHARIDLGEVVIPPDGSGFKFSAGTPRVSANAAMVDFSVIVFSALNVRFSKVAFQISEDGHKDFTVQLKSVDLLSPLDFISQLAAIFGGLGDNSVHIVPTPAEIRVWQTLQFPAGGSGPLFMGPAMISNLALGWSVTIPLRGRDVLAVGFSVSTREKPLTIYVPPWYGGKAYALIEATTRGCRLVEVSMEYGALIPIEWGIAKGQASLTAGIFFSLQRDDAANSATVILRAFVKAAANLSVASIIDFAGLIYIAMERIAGAQKIIRGTAEVSVSIKIGFVRISYSFSAVHEEASDDQHKAAAGAAVEMQAIATNALPEGTYSRIGSGAPSDGMPFGPKFQRERRKAFQRILAGYR